MYLSLIVLMAATLISTTDPAIQEPDDSIRYEITFCEDLPTRARVRASMPYSQTLFISKYGAWSQSNGWGTYIDELKVADEQGQRLAVEHDERCTWSIETSSMGGDVTMGANYQPDKEPTSLFVRSKFAFLYLTIKIQR